MKRGAGQHIKYTEQIFLRTEFMCLIVSLDRLLGGSNFFLSGDALIWLQNKATDLPSFLEVDR
jgi:hypothetical protein